MGIQILVQIQILVTFLYLDPPTLLRPKPYFDLFDISEKDRRGHEEVRFLPIALPSQKEFGSAHQRKTSKPVNKQTRSIYYFCHLYSLFQEISIPVR